MVCGELMNQDSMMIQPSPLFTIAESDKDHTIRVVKLPASLLEQIWMSLTPKEQSVNKMKRWFLYKLDNPPLSFVLKKLPACEDHIKLVKGHGLSQPVKIPRWLEFDLGYIMGAIRDGGIYHDKKSQAYKIHFAQKDRRYLEVEIVPRLDRLFGVSPVITKRPDGVHQIQLASKPLYLFLSKVFQMQEIQQYWETPDLVRTAPKVVKKAYIRGFHDAEGSSDHLYHSWYREGFCEPLQFISDVLNNEFNIRTTAPLRTKTNDEFDRFPAYQLFINDYTSFKREILDR